MDNKKRDKKDSSSIVAASSQSPSSMAASPALTPGNFAARRAIRAEGNFRLSSRMGEGKDRERKPN